MLLMSPLIFLTSVYLKKEMVDLSMGVLSNTAYFKQIIYLKLILDFTVILKLQISYQMSTQVILRTNHYDSVHLTELPVPLPLATSKIQWTLGGSVQPSLLVYTEKKYGYSTV